jgi:hypothetical protein
MVESLAPRGCVGIPTADRPRARPPPNACCDMACESAGDGVRGCRGAVADTVARVARVHRLRHRGSTGEPVPPLVRIGKRPWLPV